MSKFFVPKEILVVTVGLLLITGVALLTLFNPDTKDPITTNSYSENSSVTQFFKQVGYIQKNDLQNELPKKDLIIFDLRERTYYDISHIPKSISATPESIISLFTNQKPTPQRVILVDTSGQTPELEKSIRLLRENNVNNIRILAGGYASWDALVYPTLTWGDPESAFDHSKVRVLSVENAKTLVSQSEVVFLDVRSTKDYTDHHIEKSLNIPFDDLENSARKIPKMKMLVVYGTTPIDSFRAGVRLFDLGYHLAYTVNGGYIDLK